MPRSESVAYASANSPLDYVSRIILFCRSNATAVTATLGFVVFVLFITSDSIAEPGSNIGLRGGVFQSNPHWGGAAHPGYFKAKDAIIAKDQYSFAIVTDLDQLSRVPGSEKPVFESKLLPGQLIYDRASNSYNIKFEPLRTLISKHNEEGRGMELSELVLYNDRLLAFDDRTGSVFELLSTDASETIVAPRFVITEGEGDTDKGMKWEWATVKDNELYMGSMGKEFSDNDGNILNANALWIAIINKNGEVRREDWTDKYNFVRAALGASFPGYVVHEAVLWSEKLKKWVFVPRRISSEMYNEVTDERKGSNKLLVCDENFQNAEVVIIKMKEVDPLHGFSTIAFVPGSDDKHILAVRSVEEDCVGGERMVCKQRSYIMVFDVFSGEVLMDEIKIEQDIKFEGVEFVNIHATA